MLDDVEPFICISDNCETTSKSFGDFESWATHMSQVHSMKWTQQIHRPIRWRCDVDHAAEMFEDENAFRKHLNVEHGEYNPARREAVYSLSRVTKRRRRNICPLCNFHVTPMTAGVSQLKEVDESEQLHDLAKHIAGHLCLLAFSSAKDLDSDFDHVSGTSMKILTDPASSTKPGLPNQILDAFVMSNLGASTMLNASMKNKQISSADRYMEPPKNALEDSFTDMTDLPHRGTSDVHFSSAPSTKTFQAPKMMSERWESYLGHLGLTQFESYAVWMPPGTKSLPNGKASSKTVPEVMPS